MDKDILNLQPTWLDAQRPRMGRYVLGPLLGKGGMGEVTEAWDVVLCRTVALKILRNVEPTALIRFMHEAQIQARLVHPNICRIYDVDASEGNVKIAMQLVRGPSLEQARSELSLQTRVTLVAQVAEAVHAAHRLHLIHRDLKPSNILLERGEDGRWFPYICDFGLAMAMDEPALTYSQGVMGTPAFMAPEQFRGDRGQVGPATDVYGLGGTLHFALLGKAPDGPMGKGGPRLELPRDLVTILGKCLAADPALRYSTAAALAEDLWRFLNGEPLMARPPALPARLWRRCRPHLRSLSEAALVLVCLAGGWYGGRAQLRRVQARHSAAEAFFVGEGAELERDLRMERLLAPHDLRPAFARARARLEAMRAHLAMVPEAEVPGRLALGRAQLHLGDPAAARAEAEKLWSDGQQGPEAAALLGAALAGCSWTTPAGSAPPRLEQVLQASPGHPFQAQLAIIRQDYARAALEARESLREHPWQGESAQTQCLCLTAQAMAGFEQGQLASAESGYREAMAVAEAYLGKGPSDERVHHAYLLAARGLATLRLSRGDLPLDLLDDLQHRCEQAQRLDPGAEDLHEDWLGLQVLRARRLAALGRDPRPTLENALVYMGTRLPEPAAPALLAQRRGVFLVLAEWNFSHSGDPGQALTEALRDPQPAPPLRWDSLGEALTLKARVDAARGTDPRPAVQAALAHLQPRLRQHPSWLACEWAAAAWLAQAEWEAGHQLDAQASLTQARLLVQTALQANAGSASTLALEDLIRAKLGRVSARPLGGAAPAWMARF